MKPFSIAGIQMRVSASYSNVEAMKLKLNILMNLYPWVDMVVYSELCAFGPLTHHSLARIEDFEEPMQELARKHKVWLLPGRCSTRWKARSTTRRPSSTRTAT